MEKVASFGGRLRRLREDSGYTQEELAGRAGMTAKAISALERGERKRPYPHTLRSLADALDLSEEQRASLFAAVPRRDQKSSGPPPAYGSPAPDPPPTGLPTTMTPFLGRERELDEVQGLLGRTGIRLLTLTGVGGMGKTRLAVEAARRLRKTFPEGVTFVALAPLGDAALVGSAIVQALGLKDPARSSALDAVREHVRDRKMLLVLDNFEHLTGAAPDVAALIEGCPHLTVLVTSRAPLRVRDEQEYPVQPLGLPAMTRNPPAGEVVASPSGGLFVERARASSPSFEITEDNAGAVAAICRRLDGLPLALELAAARVRFLDPGSLLGRLDRALSAGWARDLPERQRTMRAALDWSHDLLTEEERVLFRRLSVFAGGFTLEAAEEVGAASELEAEGVLWNLGTLVEQSLVMMETDAEASRYRTLEPIRQYAGEKLEESGEEREVRGLHAGYYLALMERAGPGLKGPDQSLWVRRLVTELDNLRAALEWATANGEAERIARASWDSWTFWWSSGNLREGRRRMEEALATKLSEHARAVLLFTASTLGQGVGDFDSTWPMVEESRETFERLGDRQGVSNCLGTGGLILLGRGDLDEGLHRLLQSSEMDIGLGNKWAAAAMLGFAAAVPFAWGDLERARGYAERGTRLAREVGAADILYVNLHPLAAIALAEGDHERARRLFREGAGLALGVGENVNVAFCLERLAEISSTDEPERAARLWGAAGAILEDVEVISYAFAPDPAVRERQVSEARARLDEQAWERAWAEGRAMSPAKAVAYALEDGETPSGS